jgi:hypothetical protein
MAEKCGKKCGKKMPESGPWRAFALACAKRAL